MKRVVYEKKDVSFCTLQRQRKAEKHPLHSRNRGIRGREKRGRKTKPSTKCGGVRNSAKFCKLYAAMCNEGEKRNSSLMFRVSPELQQSIASAKAFAYVA
ncbi:hypothetical protein WN51_07575 [Melipona quadrifasciata]|uniref:Uncharacterized protein n=1 Tax=Melipona quadrifasciata TaxID=166423 RepID=A0A0N0BJC0_9HYME|nr:hypothetical protein WN51_07575 [Melipona quadrifasciata]